MLERFFVKPQTVDQIMDCWLGLRIEQYVTILVDRAYAPRSIHRRVPLLVKFAAFTTVMPASNAWSTQVFRSRPSATMSDIAPPHRP